MTTRIVWAIVMAAVLLAASTLWRAERVLGPPDTEFRYAVVVPAHTSVATIERTWRARLRGADVQVSRGALGNDARGSGEVEVEVVVRGAPRAHAAALERALDRPGAFELRWVVANSETARAWFRAIGPADAPRTDAVDIVGYADAWTVDDTGEERLDYFFVGPDRETILARLAELAPAYPVPDDLELRVEALRESDVRTYLVEREPLVRGAEVVAAGVERDPRTGRANAVITLTGDAAVRFAAATATRRGEKCAFIIDGVVAAAPVVQGEIKSGRLSVVDGPRRDDREGDAAEAEALAAVLRGGVLPAGLHARLVTATGHDRNPWPVRLVIALCGMVLAFVAAPWGRRRLPLATSDRDASQAPWRWWPPAAALLVTSAALGGLWYLRWTMLPGFSEEALDAMAGQPGDANRPLGVLSLGLAPYLTAALVVELVAMSSPRWRTRRLGTAADRRPIDRAVAVVTVGLAVVQTILLVRFFDSIVGPLGEEVLARGLLPRLALIGALLVGVALTLGAAALISRHGLGNGALIIAAAEAFERHATQPSSWALTGHGLAALTLVAAGAGFVARLRPRGVRLPWAGLAPALVTAVVLASAVTFVDSGRGAFWVRQLARDAAGWPTVVVALVATGLALWPRRAAALTVGAWGSVAAVLLLALVPVFAREQALSLAPAVLVGAAVIESCAGASRWARLRRPTAVLIVHDVDRADRAADRLALASIPYAVTGVHARALLRFLAAYCPITVSVAAVDVEAAAAVLADEPGR